MNDQTFELLRLPRVNWDRRVVVWLGIWFALADRMRVLGLVVLGIWLAWAIYRLRRSTQHLRLTKTQLSLSNSGLTLQREEVEEIYPSPKGVTIAWRRKGVARYTDIPENHFAENVWAQARAALLKWGNAKV